MFAFLPLSGAMCRYPAAYFAKPNSPAAQDQRPYLVVTAPDMLRS